MKKAIFTSNTSFSLYAFRKALMLALKEKGWEVVTIAPSGQYRKKIEDLGIRFVEVNLDRKGKNPVKDSLYFLQLLRIYRRERPDLVHHFTIKPVIYGTLAAWFSGVSSIVNTVTGLGNVFVRERWVTNLVRFMYRISLRFSSMTIFQNHEDRSEFVSRGLVTESHSTVILGSGVNTAYFSSPDRGRDGTHATATTFLMAGRMLWDKGVREYVEAARIATSLLPRCRFLLVGASDAGNPSAVPMQWLSGLNDEGIVRWRDGVEHDEMRSVIEEADVVVLPSYREGVPRVLLEAASMGKAIITCDTVGCRDAIEEGKSGLLVPPRDSRSLADAMICLAKDEAMRRRMGEAGRERVISIFDDQKVIDQIFRVYALSGSSIHAKVGDGSLGRAIFLSNSAMATYMFRKSLLLDMQKRGWEVIAAGPDDKYSEQITALGIPYRPITIDRKGKNPLKDAFLVLKLARFFRKERPDLVHNFTVKPVIYGSIAAKLTGVKAVANTITGLGYVFLHEGWLASLVRFMYRIAIKRGTFTLFLNREDIDYFLQHGIVTKDSSDIICGEGVDTVHFQPPSTPHPSADTSRVTFLMAARMLWDKGVGEYVEACELVAKKNGMCRFVLVGASDEGNPAAVPVPWLQALKTKGVVDWMGEVNHDDMRTVMADADVVVLPSFYREGVPRILLEAASMGKPLITTDWVGCRDVVADGCNGILIPPRDSASLTSAMLRLAADPGLRMRMGQEGRKRVLKTFDEKVIIQEIYNYYRKLGVSTTGESSALESAV